MHKWRGAIAALSAALLALVGLQGTAYAASTTLTSATVHQTAFTFTCSTDSAGTLIARSWRDPNLPTPTVLDTSAPVAAGGSVTQTRDDGLEETGYAYRCLLYSSTGTLITKTATALNVTTGRIRPLFGSNSNGVWRSTYDPIKVQRVFAGAGLPAWGVGDLAAPIATVLSTKLPVAEVNAGSWDARIAAWAPTFPTNRDIHLLLWHEPENEVYKFASFTAAEWRAANIRMRNLVMANKPAAARVSWDVDLMSSTLFTAGRDWREFFPDNDGVLSNGSPYVDTLAWDNYWGTTDGGTTPPPDDVFDRFGTGSHRDIFAANVVAGNTPIGVAEWGYDHDATRVDILRQIENWGVYGPGSAGGVPPTTSDHPPVPVKYIIYFDNDAANSTTGDHDLDRADGLDRLEWKRIVAA
jgi:hypothetical protein